MPTWDQIKLQIIGLHAPAQYVREKVVTGKESLVLAIWIVLTAPVATETQLSPCCYPVGMLALKACRESSG